jgi:hypothetical protein
MPAKKKTTRLKKRQGDFRLHWFAIFRSVAAHADGSITPGELRLAMRLLAVCLLKGKLTARIAEDQIKKATKLTRSSLYAAHAALTDRHIIAAPKKDAEGYRVYEFLNPATGKPFPGVTGAVTVEDDWGRVTFSSWKD